MTFTIELNQVHLKRDDQTVLSDLTLTLSERRIGLIGDNGSGKSSLVRLLNGLLQPSQGTLRVRGHNPADGPEVMSDQVGFIFQNPDHQLIFPTVIEELMFGLRNQGLSKSDARDRAEGCLREHHRLDWAERPVHSLSEGQKQWVCIMAVLVMNPAVLILDEPFSALDLPTRQFLTRWLLGLPQQLIMISHDLDVLSAFDRVLWLEQGRIRGDGAPDAVIADYRSACSGDFTL
ncbi:energy-coupling factor ABC transporter ATP-binding protein [Saccharospirillum impatiens]|uniref:energy-coupling factor ABC transporter ATP-binding protein n=1 Tax=Saccharospirillum impatiens TaxID=169438 RepID=UPI0004261428|nr:ABC transporter ATP-binding protein [Saccharospirillum impatiens]